MIRAIAKKLFNSLPPFVQHLLTQIEPRFLNHIDLHKLLDYNFAELSFIQVGANDGVSFDNLFDYLQKTKIKNGIVIEPIPEYFQELQNNYSQFKNVKCLNYALHPTDNEVTLYKVDTQNLNLLPEWSKGIASILPGHHSQLGIPTEYIIPEKVKCINFKKLFDKYADSSNHFNLLQIDTEGFDAEIIKMIDFKTIYFDVIKFESINLSEQDLSNTINLLLSSNYTIAKGYDAIAINKKIKIILK